MILSEPWVLELRARIERDYPDYDPQYLDWIRSLPCEVAGHGYRPRGEWEDRVVTHRCIGQGSDPHHVIARQWRDVKRFDRMTVPLCRLAHRQIESWGRTKFERRYGYNTWQRVEQLIDRYERWYKPQQEPLWEASNG